MSPQNMPAAEVEVTDDLVRRLLVDQHRDLADLPIALVANGWDNVIFRLGDELTVRLPRRAQAAVLVEHEQRVLPALAPRLPLPIPAPVRIGRPALGYPWSWSIGPWFRGTSAATTPFSDPKREAERLGHFLRSLNEPAPPDAPPNPYRGHFVGDNTAVFAERVGRLRGMPGFDDERITERWKQLVAVDRYGDVPRWIHGDLHGFNVLVDGGQISAVIDFGDVCAGDPATDLSAAWGLFERAARERFRDAAGDVVDATWQRAEAWALHFAVVYLLASADNPAMHVLGETILERLGLTNSSG